MKRLKLSSHKILAVLFCLIIFFFLGTIAERVFRYSVLGQNPDLIAAETEEGATADSNKEDPYVKQFPFKDADKVTVNREEKTEADAEPAKKTFFSEISRYVNILKVNESFYAEKLLFSRMQFVNLNAKFNKTIGMKIFEDANNLVVSMLDGNLTMKPLPQDVTDSAKAVVDFSQELKKSGTEFLYVQAPSKVDPQNNLLPLGIEDYDNAAADEILGTLRKNGVNCMDIRQLIHERNLDYTDAFFKTDHHWTIETGFWVSGEIADYIKNNTSVKIDSSKFNIDNYTKKVYKDISLGSLGKAVSAAYAEPEDFTVILPKFETDFEFFDFYDHSYRGGSFDKSLINLDILQKKDYYNVSTYSSYMYTWSSLVSIENKMAENDSSILVIGDSFRHSVVPFLSTGVKNVYSISV